MPQFPLHHNKHALPVYGNSMEWRRQIDFGLMFQRCDMIWLCIQHTTVFCQCQMHILFRYTIFICIYIYIYMFLLIWIYMILCLYIYIFIIFLCFHFNIYITYIHHMRKCRYNPEFDNVATTRMDSLHFFCRNPWNWRMTRSRWMAAEPHHRSALVVNDPVLARVKLQKGWWTKSGEVFFLKHRRKKSRVRCFGRGFRYELSRQ